ncbi:MAG: glutaredoxin family protein, partial [Gammaproteobacteria bacterium]
MSSGLVAAVQAVEFGTLEVYVRDGCPHCKAAKQFLPQVVAQRPQLRIVYHSLDQDPNARNELINLSVKAGIWPPGVPTFVMHGKVLTGFDDA